MKSCGFACGEFRHAARSTHSSWDKTAVADVVCLMRRDRLAETEPDVVRRPLATKGVHSAAPLPEKRNELFSSLLIFAGFLRNEGGIVFTIQLLRHERAKPR